MGESNSKEAPPPPSLIADNNKRIAKEMHKIDADNFFNFGVAGHFNTGKSSLINSMRGLLKNEPMAAPVEAYDNTEQITLYTDPRHQYIRFYDIPGSGIKDRSADDYFQKNGLAAFDCLIIMTQSSLGIDELDFANDALKHHQTVCFVRAHCDQDMDNMVHDESIDEVNQANVINHLVTLNKKYTTEISTKAQGLKKIPIFFISNRVLRLIMKGNRPAVCYMEKRLIDFLINAVKNQRHIIDLSPAEY